MDPKAQTGAVKWRADFPVLAVFSAQALQPRRASPERVGEYRQTQPF